MECQNSTQCRRYDLLGHTGVIFSDFKKLFFLIKSSMLVLKESKLSERYRPWIKSQKFLEMKILEPKIRSSGTKIQKLDHNYDK